MMKLLTCTVLLLTLMACNNDSSNKEPGTGDSLRSNTDSSTANRENSDGWQKLFDGQTTKGWHKYGGAPAGAAWKISDGAIYLDTSSKKDWQTANGGDIVTDEEFENFDLKLEWKIAPKGNSGVMFYVHEDTVKFKHSYES